MPLRFQIVQHPEKFAQSGLQAITPRKGGRHRRGMVQGDDDCARNRLTLECRPPDQCRPATIPVAATDNANCDQLPQQIFMQIQNLLIFEESGLVDARNRFQRILAKVHTRLVQRSSKRGGTRTVHAEYENW